MTTFNHSMCVICPNEYKATLLAFGQALGVDGGMGVKLSATALEPPTHWGSHSWATPEFVAVMTGQVVPEIEGVTPEQISAVVGQCVVSVDPVDGEGNVLTGRAHFDHALAQAGLVEIQVE